DADDALGADFGAVHPAGGQVEAVAGAKLETVAARRQVERDRATQAVEHLAVVVAVPCVGVERVVRPPVRLKPLAVEEPFQGLARGRDVLPAGENGWLGHVSIVQRRAARTHAAYETSACVEKERCSIIAA